MSHHSHSLPIFWPYLKENMKTKPVFLLCDEVSSAGNRYVSPLKDIYAIVEDRAFDQDI